jgi:hypothetical protein
MFITYSVEVPYLWLIFIAEIPSDISYKYQDYYMGIPLYYLGIILTDDILLSGLFVRLITHL